MAPSFPDTGDCLYYVVQNRIPFIQMRTRIQRSRDYIAARIRSFLTGHGRTRAWRSTPKQSVTLRRTSFLLVRRAHYVWLSRHRSIIFLPVSVRKGAWAQDGSGQSTATGIRNCGRDYFKCQHNVTSSVRRSNVQTVLSGEQLIDQVRFVLLWLLWRAVWHAKTSCEEEKKSEKVEHDFATSQRRCWREFRNRGLMDTCQSNGPIVRTRAGREPATGEQRWWRISTCTVLVRRVPRYSPKGLEQRRT